MEKLTPQNKHQEHTVQVLLAKMQGIPVEFGCSNDWREVHSELAGFTFEYRIVQRPTPLPISHEMWRMINKKWKWAVKDKGGNVWFYTHEPSLGKEKDIWVCHAGDYCRSILIINTDGIDWKQSLTKRPEDV